MKRKTKSKSHPSHRSAFKAKKAQKKPSASVPHHRGNTEITEHYTPMETGQPDQDAFPESNNPAGAQGGPEGIAPEPVRIASEPDSILAHPV